MADFVRNLVAPICQGDEMIHVVTLRRPSPEGLEQIRQEAALAPEQGMVEGALSVLSILSGLEAATLADLDLQDSTALTIAMIPMIKQMVALVQAPDTPDTARH